MMSEHCQNPLISADSDDHGNHLNGLTTRHDRALMALLEPPLIVAAARKAEVGENTPRQWLREGEDFPGNATPHPQRDPLPRHHAPPTRAAIPTLPTAHTAIGGR